MSVILDIDLDYFGLVKQPVAELEKMLTWAGRPADVIVQHHHEAYARWKEMVRARILQAPGLIVHVDEHHDMMSERPPPNFGNFIYFAMGHWPDCRVVSVTPHPIDDPSMWLSEDAWEDVAPRFACARGLSRRWPKPDVLSVCTNPEFIDRDLSTRLLARVRRRRGGLRS